MAGHAHVEIVYLGNGLSAPLRFRRRHRQKSTLRISRSSSPAHEQQLSGRPRKGSENFNKMLRDRGIRT